jgi:V8-like Glu-specific endopeptidase
VWPRLIGALALIVVAGIVAAQGRAGNVNSVPLEWAGKLFYSEPSGDYVCSGQFIGPNVILTAAHCVRDPDSGDWYRNFEFQLQYNNGSYSRAYRPSCVCNGSVQNLSHIYSGDGFGLHDLRLIERSHVHVALGGPCRAGDVAQPRGRQVEA